MNLNLLTTTSAGANRNYKGKELELNSVNIGLPDINSKNEKKKKRPQTASSISGSNNIGRENMSPSKIREEEEEFSMATTSRLPPSMSTSLISTLASNTINNNNNTIEKDEKYIHEQFEAEFKNLSLDVYISSFKEKYFTLQKQNAATISLLESRIASLINENYIVTKQSQRDHTEKSNLLLKYTTLDNNFKTYRDESGSRELALASKLEKLTTVLTSKDKQHNNTIELNTAELSDLKLQVQKQKEQIDEKDVKLKDYKSKLDEIYNNAANESSNITDLKRELEVKTQLIATLEKELIEHKVTIKKQELQLNLSTQAQALIESAHTDVSNENAIFSARILALETQLLDKTAESLAIQLSQSQKQEKEAREALESMKREHSEKQSRMDLIMQEKVNLTSQLDNLVLDVKDLTQHLKDHEFSENSLLENKAKLEQKNTAQFQEIEQLRTLNNSLTEKLELTSLERDEASEALQAAQAKITTNDSVTALMKLEQFHGMMKANMEVADSIKTIMTKLDNDKDSSLDKEKIRKERIEQLRNKLCKD